MAGASVPGAAAREPLDAVVIGAGGIGKELTNLAAMAKAGYSASRRLLDAERISHDPAAGTAALETLTSPVISTTCTRVPGLRFPDPRVQATALFFTRLTRRVIIPALAQIAGTSPPPGSPLRQADRAYKAAVADLAAQASLGIQPRSVTKRQAPRAPVVTRNPS